MYFLCITAIFNGWFVKGKQTELLSKSPKLIHNIKKHVLEKLWLLFV